MKNRKLLLLSSLFLSLASVVLPGRAAQEAEETARVIVRFKPQADSVKARIMSARMSRSEVQDVAQTRAASLGLRTGLGGARMKARLSLDERTHVFTARGESSVALAKRLARDSEVEFVAVDQRRRHTSATLPNDPLYGGATPTPMSTSNGVSARIIDQWYLKKPAGDVISSIDAPAAWATTTGAASIVVAVLDTGVRKDHPDLAGQIVGGWDMIGFGSPGALSTAIANDGNGSDDDASDPGDWVSQSDIGSLGSDCTSADISSSSWHGTRVSGLIAALSDNSVGMAGVARGVKILPVRVLGKCGGYDSDIIAGMKWAAGVTFTGQPSVNPNPAKVLNMSLGGSGACGTTGTGALYREAITAVNARGATIVVAAGNSTGQAVGVPGNCPGVVTVTGLRHVGSKVGFASVGPEVSIAAPGGNCINILSGQPCLYPMVSTTNAGAQGPVANDGSYTGSGASVGTSFSTPVVAGTVALMLSVKPTLTSAEVLDILKRTSRPFVASGATDGTTQCHAPNSQEQLECYCTTATCGAGMLDAGAAVAAAQGTADPSPATIAISPASPTANQTISVTASVTLAAGRSVASTAWTLVSAGTTGVAGFASGATSATATLAPTAAGTITVQVAVTDDLGAVHVGNGTITVAAAPPVTPTPPTTPSGGGGGGGAASPVWLALLGLAALALRRRYS